MVAFELKPEEVELLHEMCKSDLADLRMEIAGTDNAGFRDVLKSKEVLLRGLIERLAHAASTIAVSS